MVRRRERGCWNNMHQDDVVRANPRSKSLHDSEFWVGEFGDLPLSRGRSPLGSKSRLASSPATFLSEPSRTGRAVLGSQATRRPPRSPRPPPRVPAPPPFCKTRRSFWPRPYSRRAELSPTRARPFEAVVSALPIMLCLSLKAHL